MSIKLHSLIVDDDEKIREGVAMAVHSMGHTSSEAGSQKEALELLSQKTFDFFIIDLVIPFDEEDEGAIDCGYNLIEQIREEHPNSVEYPVIAITAHGRETHYFRRAMEVGANSYLVKPFNSPDNKTSLREIISKLTQKALLKRREKESPGKDKACIDINPVLERLAEKYTLVVDLKTMEVYFKGIKLPSGRNGLQQRHKVFLFILARNPDKALSEDDIHKEIKELGLDDFGDPQKNIKSQIKKTLRKLVQEHPDKVFENDIRDFLKTIPVGQTKLTLSQKEVFTIYGQEAYPSI